MDSVQREFTFSFKTKEYLTKLAVPISIPPTISCEEFAGRLMNAHSLPCFVEDELTRELEKFVAKAVEDFHNENGETAIKLLQSSGDEEIGNMADKWARAFTQECVSYAPNSKPKEEAVFGEKYHGLIHSPALETVFKLEHTYSMDVENIVRQRDAALRRLQNKQADEMERAVQNLDITHDDLHVNRLAAIHFDNTQREEAKWDNELRNLQDSQRGEFHQWIKSLHEDMANGMEGPVSRRIRALSDSMPVEPEEVIPEQPQMEESFTIHLGAQMKTMHNLRLMSVDVLDLCRHKPNREGGILRPQPQRLQTALSLYSTNLAGLVLMVDDRISSYTGIKRDFATVCQQSTDFHFPDLETQLRVIHQGALKVNARRKEQRKLDGDMSSSSSSDGSRPTSLHEDGELTTNLKTGDFYVTRHSNLAQCHVIFHLVSDDSLRSAEINSRHPCILALRNILKYAVQFDILSITMPLFLMYEMYEEMTIPWCTKRAELVFKCVKGFMMEMATWGGNESRTVQFVVPKGISEDLFSQLSSMLPQIFRMSRTVDLTHSKQK
ncbi:FERRY endosomal RAB5 effector complex subunit 3-like [Diadema setosum]|uniref:FERRY endosomal RAB5 effector complex subunit 3-like n=1 Tax=Diadema setosum TaxID=31175 RepID=UPI003B3A26DA